jgi:hypothetical protein
LDDHRIEMDTKLAATNNILASQIMNPINSNSSTTVHTQNVKADINAELTLDSLHFAPTAVHLNANHAMLIAENNDAAVALQSSPSQAFNSKAIASIASSNVTSTPQRFMPGTAVTSYNSQLLNPTRLSIEQKEEPADAIILLLIKAKILSDQQESV